MSDICCIFCASVLECNAITYNDVLVYSSHKNNGLPSIYYLTVYRLLITLFAVPFGVLVIHSRHDYPELALIWLMCIYNNYFYYFDHSESKESSEKLQLSLKTFRFHFSSINSMAETCTATTTIRQTRWQRRKYRVKWIYSFWH